MYLSFIVVMLVKNIPRNFALQLSREVINTDINYYII